MYLNRLTNHLDVIILQRLIIPMLPPMARK